jgi:steroid delta-isomerase-like uncharacterized protein
MSTKKNKAIASRFLIEAFSKKNPAIVDELISTNYVYHGAGGRELRGREGVKQEIAVIATAFPDIHMSIEDTIAEGDKVVCRYSVRGTHKGDFLGIAPTGKQFTLSGMVISRIEKGKIVEDWENVDPMAQLQQQLGVAPPVGGGG